MLKPRGAHWEFPGFSVGLSASEYHTESPNTKWFVCIGKKNYKVLFPMIFLLYIDIPKALCQVPSQIKNRLFHLHMVHGLKSSKITGGCIHFIHTVWHMCAVRALAVTQVLGQNNCWMQISTIISALELPIPLQTSHNNIKINQKFALDLVLLLT